MNGIKVCHLTTVHPAFDNRILLKECVSLAGAGFEVVLLAPNAKKQKYDGVHIHPIRIPGNRLLRMTWGVTSMFFAAMRQRARIYHFHDPELMPVGLVLRLLGKKVIGDVHENYPASLLSKPYLNKTVAVILSKIIGVIEFLLLSTLNAVVTATPWISNRFKRLQPITIHNFPIVPDIESIPKAGVPSTCPGIIYVGGLTRIRGILELIRAIENLEGVELWLLGSFETESFRKQCEALPGWSKVRYLGVSEPQGVYAYLKAAKIGIATLLPSPNYLNALATKSFEYMAVGLPMIMSDFPYWKEYFGDSAIYVDPTESEGIKDAITSLLSNPVLMEKMGSSNLVKSKRYFRWDIEADKLIKLYKELAG